MKLLLIALISMIVLSTATNEVVAGTTLPIGNMDSETERKILNISNLVKSRYLMDTSDAKLYLNDLFSKIGDLFNAGSKCSADRVGTLSAAYRNLVGAVASADAELIWVYANGLRFHAYGRSSMYTSCWNHLQRQAQILGDLSSASIDIINIGTEAGLRWSSDW